MSASRAADSQLNHSDITPTPSLEPIQAQVGLAFSEAGTGQTPEWIQYMPAGAHTITAKRGGRAVRIEVNVTEAGAERMQASLAALTASSRQRPYFDFDHEGKRASAWPLEFAWRDDPEPGIYARVQWSDAGRAAVAGRDYRAFSPTFFVTAASPAEVDGAPMNMGALVNDPAFRDIAPLWARDASGTAGSQKPTDSETHMDQTTKTELAALQAKVAALEAEKAELTAQVESSESEEALEAARQELDAANSELKRLKDESELRIKRDADAAVASAVARGAIAAKDETTQAKWRNLIIADASNAELLAKLPSRVQAGRITPGARRERQEPARVLKSDLRDVLKAYQASKGNPMERGAIYRAEIDPILAKGEVLPFHQLVPVEASNTLGDLVGDIISQRTLALIVSKRPMLKTVVTDFSSEQARYGQVVTTRTVGLPTVQNFGGTVSETDETDVDVTMDAFKEVRYTFTATEYGGTNRNLVAEHAEAMAVALGNSIVDAAAALITDANYGTTNETVSASGNVTYSTITAINKGQNNLGVPDTYRAAWVNEDVAEALRNDEVVMANFNRGPMATAYAHWNNIVGYSDIYEYPALPANSCNLTGFFFARDAICIVSRIPMNPEIIAGAGYPGSLQVVTDPVTGLSVLSNRWIAQDTLAVNTRLIVLYGADLGNATCGWKLVSA